MFPTPSPFVLLDSRYAVRCVTPPVAGAVLPLAYEPYLYLRPEYVALQQGPGEALFFYLEDHQRGYTVGQWPLTLANQQACSPWQAPFGGVQLAPGVSAGTARGFVAAVHQALLVRGAARVHVRAYPASYDETASHRLLSVFRELGYRIARTETNSTLPLAQSFEDGLHPSARRRLRKCQRHGLRVEQETPLFLPLAHEFMQQCRLEKGQPPPPELAHLQALFRTFPNDYFLFSVRDAAGAWVALTVLNRVSSQVLRCFHPASPLSQNTFSPVILLMQGVHAFGQASGYHLLDLGPAPLPEESRLSLLTFRRHLGSVPGPHFAWEW